MYLCYVTYCTLKEVVKGEKMPWNPDTQSIKVVTDSTVGSRDMLDVEFYDKVNSEAGSLKIAFRTPIKYSLGSCANLADFASVLPAAPDKNWTITYNTTELSVALQCNGKQVLNVMLTDSVCTNSDWRDVWEKEPTQIEFDMFDKASDSYCISGNTGNYTEGFQKA